MEGGGRGGRTKGDWRLQTPAIPPEHGEIRKSSEFVLNSIAKIILGLDLIEGQLY